MGGQDVMVAWLEAVLDWLEVEVEVGLLVVEEDWLEELVVDWLVVVVALLEVDELELELDWLVVVVG